MAERRRTGAASPSAPGLFADQAPPAPLAERLRPRRLDEIVGQPQLIGPDGALSRLVAAHQPTSLIFWGPPGVGKTTLARLLAEAWGLRFAPLSAVMAGVADVKTVFAEARAARVAGQGTLLFLDEVHRFNRAQQDALLPAVEDGTVVLVGATTENPSFALNGALLSRARVLVLRRLDREALGQLLDRAEALMGRPVPLQGAAREQLLDLADGDGRYLLNLVESLLATVPADAPPLDEAGLIQLAQRRAPLYDRAQEEHYNLISALHKAVRGSDPDAALYWFARMLEGGEDPRFLARRLVRMAVEDIGLADPGALAASIAAWEAYERLGSPEGELALAQIVVHLAAAPKSVAVYRAYGAARRVAGQTGSLGPPLHIRNAPTRLMRDLGYGAGYQYDPDAPDGLSGQTYWPEGMAPEQFYRPGREGIEARIADRLERVAALRAQRQGATGEEGAGR